VAADDDDGSCVICYDAPGTCVFLECGHSGFCRRCARLLYVRPPNECPACRQPLQLVRREGGRVIGRLRLGLAYILNRVYSCLWMGKASHLFAFACQQAVGIILACLWLLPALLCGHKPVICNPTPTVML
jgi:hypothetical protein